MALISGSLRMAAELVPHRRQYPVRKGGRIAGRKPLVERGAQYRRRDGFVDRRLHSPAPFAGVRYTPRICFQLRILVQGARGQVEQP